ncbi:MAG: glycoside hydrolase family 76 protein [Ginsengibacter sp.]
MKKLLITSLPLIILLTSCHKGKDAPTSVQPPADSTTAHPVSVYLTMAKETNKFITSSLLTSYNSYIVNTSTNTNSAFEWYNASQIYADAAMIEIGDSSYLRSMNATFGWMENMWDKADSDGGYFAFSNLDGSGASGTKYVDDNSLTGMVYLQAYDLTTGRDRDAYLSKAEACANWIIKSGLWDTSLGGGFWWNTEKIYKPTQTNGLALQLFLRLYGITGESVYHDWASSINNWLTTKMYDGHTGLFIWQYDNTGKKYSQIFTYDNAIMLEAYLWCAKVMNDPAYLSKAEAIARAMNATLWDGAHNVYIFNTADKRINPAWCGWASQAMVRLYEADKNASWLTYAKGNVDAINTVLKDPSSHGYYQFAGLDGAGRYANMEGVDQAWMQRTQALLSKYK